MAGAGLFVYSEPGRGTTFKIYLPHVNQPVSQTQDQHPAGGKLRGTETVLVVEDEQAVRRLIEQALSKYGYRVLEVADGGEALSICRAHRTPIQLMITDVVKPHMSSPELATRVGKRHPEMRILYMSGYTDDAVLRHGLLDASMSFLQKPFTPVMLVRRARETLDQAVPPQVG